MVEEYLDLPSLAAAQQADEGVRTHSELRGDPQCFRLIAFSEGLELRLRALGGSVVEHCSRQ